MIGETRLNGASILSALRNDSQDGGAPMEKGSARKAVKGRRGERSFSSGVERGLIRNGSGRHEKHHLPGGGKKKKKKSSK
jgi:hypothetical protein